jgi:hypothetical protein
MMAGVGQAAFLAMKALGYSTLLTSGVAAVSVWLLARAWNVHNLPEFNDKLRTHLPAVSRSMEGLLDRVGLRRAPIDATTEVTPEEIHDIDAAWEEARHEVWKEVPDEPSSSSASSKSTETQSTTGAPPPAKKPWRPWFVRIFQKD